MSIAWGILQPCQMSLAFTTELLQIMFLSLIVSGTATLVASVIAIPLGSLIAMKRFPGKQFVKTLTYTLMGLPPVVAGLVIYLILSRSGPLGVLGLLYSPAAMIMAQVLMATPIVMGVTISAVSSVPPEVKDTALSLGATEWQCTSTILNEGRIGLITAIITGFGACISEVGAVMIVGGNIRFETRVLTTAIVLDTNVGEYGTALTLGLVLLILAFLVNVPLVMLQRRGGAKYRGR